jgi:hypothetical protein
MTEEQRRVIALQCAVQFGAWDSPRTVMLIADQFAAYLRDGPDAIPPKPYEEASHGP